VGLVTDTGVDNVKCSVHFEEEVLFSRSAVVTSSLFMTIHQRKGILEIMDSTESPSRLS
jgi:hypothetical protein